MSWLDNYSTTNTFRSMYINGFIDISGGRLQTRSVTDGHLLIAGDTSLNGNLYVGGDISWNPTSLANDSIPSSAIIGGAVGATGPAGANQSARKFITIVAPSNSSHTSSSSGLLEYIVFNIFNAASSDAKPMLYSNMSDVEYRIFHAASTIQNHSRKMAFRVTPGLWKCTISTSTGNSMEAGIWWLDHNRNAINDSTGTERHGGNVMSTNQDVFIYVEGDDHSSTDALIGFEMDDDYVNTAYHAPVFHLEQIFEHTSLTGDDATNDDFGITSGISSWTQPYHNTNDPNRTLQITLANSSTEVASFHSNADLSLNKRLFVGEDVTLNKRLFVGEDVSLNGNLYVGGDISWNPTSLANDSIPSSAIITEFMLLTVSNPSSQFNQFCNMSYNITGNMDMLADPYALRQQGTSSSIHSNQWNSVCMTMLFNPGVYRVTFTGRVGTIAEFSFGFDLNHNNYIGFSYMNSGEEAFAGGASSDRVTTSYTYVVPNKTNFYFLEQLSPGTMEWFQHEYAAPQLMFERIAHIEPSGTDDTLTGYSGMPAANSTQLIAGGITW